MVANVIHVDDFEDDAVDAVRAVERDAERRINRFRRLHWRQQHWGGVMLTEREYEALVYERQVIAERASEFRLIEKTVQEAVAAQQRADAFLYGAKVVPYLVARGHYGMVALKAERQQRRVYECGIQSVVAGKMHISQGRVSQLLSSASEVMAYLDTYTPTFAGWERDRRGQWVLNAPVAAVTHHAQIISVNFEPQRLIKIA